MKGEGMEQEQEQEQGTLAALGGAAAAMDAETGEDEFGPAPGGAEQGAEAAPDVVGEMRAVLAVAVGMLSPVLPYLPAIYTDEVQGRLAAAYVPVADKYGWQTGGGIFEKYGAEIMLAATVLPLAVQTRAAHGQWMEERAEAERKKAGPGSRGEPVRQEKAGAPAVQFGTAEAVA